MKENFVAVAKLNEIKTGKLLKIHHKGMAYMLANVEGRIYATDDLCSHEDASLSTGALKGDCVSCPLHGSRFNVRTGEPMEEPATEAIATYAVRIEGDKILVNFD